MTDKKKRSFFQATIVLILLYVCSKRLEKRLDDNYTRILLAILNRSWRQHPQSSSFTATITKAIQIRRTRHTGRCWRSRDELISDILYRPLHMAEQKQGDQLEPTYSVALWTSRKRWTKGRGGERGYPCWWHEKMVMISLHIFISPWAPEVNYKFITNSILLDILINHTFIFIFSSFPSTFFQKYSNGVFIILRFIS